jgi:hypothetical protein
LNNIKQKSIPKISYLFFPKIKNNNDKNCKKILENLENLLNYHMVHKYGFKHRSPFLLDFKGNNLFSLNMIEFQSVEISNFQNKDDTGLVISKIIMDAITEKDKIINYLKFTVNSFLFIIRILTILLQNIQALILEKLLKLDMLIASVNITQMNVQKIQYHTLLMD